MYGHGSRSTFQGQDKPGHGPGARRAVSRLFNPHLLRAHEARLVGAARRGPSGMQQYTPRGLADKVKSLSQSKVWWAEATLALNASDEAMKAAVWNATDEDAIALVNKLLQRSAKRRKLEQLPQPSALANPATWQAVQQQNQDAPIFRCFRPGGASPTAALPMGLYAPELDQVVALFAKAMNGEDDDPLSQEDCEVTFNLCEEMSRHFTNKVERGQALEAIMERYLGMTVRKEYPNSSISKALTDGSICCDTFYSRAPLNAPVYIQAVKAEIGTEGDPYFEGQRMYQLYLMNDKLAPVVRCSVLPVLFVELVGPHIRVSALASPEDACVVCEPLTPYLHLFNMLSSQRSHMRRVARVLRALKRSVVLLKEACRKLPQPPAAAAPARLGAAAAAGMPDERHLDLQLPYPLRPGSGFRDVVALVPGNSRLLYAATHVQSGREVLVKFSSSSEHAARVHAAWAAAGLAPELIDSQLLPCGLTMHVMEYLSRDDGWTMFYSLSHERKQELSDVVLDKLQEAHAIDVGDGARAVHADMRQGNVMVRLRKGDSTQQLEEPHQVRFLDFDWSGLVGQTRLPPFMRQRIGFGSGQEVTQEYDRDLWNHELRWGGD